MMPDLLAHVFLAYSICRILSVRWSWLTKEYVTLGMVGAIVPDLLKIRLLLSDPTMMNLLGFSFSWGSLSSGGGVILSVLIGVTLLEADERWQGGLMLAVGAASHMASDSLLRSASGYTTQLLWPALQVRTPTPGLYLSTQIEPMILSGAIAVLAWRITRRTTQERNRS